jgi:ATP synthase protein I
MVSTDAKIFLRSAVPTSAVGVAQVGIGALVYGTKGAIAAAIGLGVVVVFFALSTLAVNRASKISPQVTMITALATYLIKVIALIVLAMAFRNTTAFNGKYFGISALVCVLVWIVTQVMTFARLRVPYVEPRGALGSGRGQ